MTPAIAATVVMPTIVEMPASAGATASAETPLTVGMPASKKGSSATVSATEGKQSTAYIHLTAEYKFTILFLPKNYLKLPKNNNKKFEN